MRNEYKMDKQYWEDYYKRHNTPFEPSDFARFVHNYLNPRGDSIVDIGCGNGRDSIYFAENGINTTAIDQSETAVEMLEGLNMDNLRAQVDDFTDPHIPYNTNHVYSRFTLHSIDEESEDKVIKWVAERLGDGYFFIEVRSDKDALVDKKTDHFRRFVNHETLLTKLFEAGFEIKYTEISRGFSRYKKEFDVSYNEDDPMLIRVVAKGGK